tara:strand:- start:870 stop:1316 length:447 start_codon:yes stop_codon:yes gene_type:complete
MADSKLTELTAATSVAAADQLYLVQSSTSKRVTAANVFGAIATPTVFGDKVSIGDHQTVTSAGVLSNDVNVHIITNPASGGTLTMTAGVEGQLKIIIMSSNTSAVTLTLDDSDLGHDTITFNNAGDTTTLIYAGSKWWSIGGSATIVN